MKILNCYERRLFSGFLVILGAAAALLAVADARADWVFVPDSRHQLYETYGLFIDEQSTLIWTGAAHAWGALGGNMPIYGNNEAESHPQVTIHGSANASMRFNESLRVSTEIIDARLGAAFEFALQPDLRLAFGIEHHSGHAADGIADLALLDTNLGDNLFTARVVKDFENTMRVGATFKPFVQAAPDKQFFAADQFAEWFPWGENASPHGGSPYAAMSFEEYGSQAVSLSLNLQAGVNFGSHFREAFHKTFRPVVGYYHGVDPRLKFAAFRDSKVDFGYFGFMFDL